MLKFGEKTSKVVSNIEIDGATGQITVTSDTTDASGLPTDARGKNLLFTPNVKHTVVYGASANQSVWWDNHAAAHLGWKPKDNSEVFRAKVDAQPPVAANDPNAIYQGGAFTAQGPFGD